MPIVGTFIVPHPPLIVPAVGRGEEGKIRRTVDAYQKVGRQVAALSPETVVVISPHSVLYSNYLHISPGGWVRGDFGQFRAPEVAVRRAYDTELVEKLCEEAARAGIPAGTHGERNPSLDHGVLVPLTFIEPYLSDYRLVRLSIAGLPFLTHYRFGECIARAAQALDRRVVLVASGDLSHRLREDGPYGFAPEGPEFDRRATEAMASGDFLSLLRMDPDFCERAGECGLRSFIEMAGALDGRAVRPELLSYEGPFGVGYAVCRFEIGGEDAARHFGDRFEQEQLRRLDDRRENEDVYVRLARKTLETFVTERRMLPRPQDLPGELTGRRAGVFVSLKKDGRLRGCIGTIGAVTACVADEIIRNAVSAGTEDPRFDPVEADELAELVYSVDVLGEPEPVEADHPQLDPKRYGVIVTSGRRRGLLLPDLEGVDTPAQQIAIAMQKAGIAKDERFALERFEVVRHT